MWTILYQFTQMNKFIPFFSVMVEEGTKSLKDYFGWFQKQWQEEFMPK